MWGIFDKEEAAKIIPEGHRHPHFKKDDDEAISGGAAQAQAQEQEQGARRVGAAQRGLVLAPAASAGCARPAGARLQGSRNLCIAKYLSRRECAGWRPHC